MQLAFWRNYIFINRISIETSEKKAKGITYI